MTTGNTDADFRGILGGGGAARAMDMLETDLVLLCDAEHNQLRPSPYVRHSYAFPAYRGSLRIPRPAVVTEARRRGVGVGESRRQTKLRGRNV